MVNSRVIFEETSTIPPTPVVSSPASNDSVVTVRNISKMYPLYADPRDRLKQSLWYALPRFLRGKPRRFYREFWALRDISFEVKKGEAVGVIGRNGSGKSTLLQIIAGTLTPTTGEVQISGRVAALLELGSGFNPQFTGRENVYLNGTILGLSREEMDERFDEIAAFADIGDFIDQPVKLYSSGMFVRLAFAVQACVEPDVLIVDEALSVGDIFFQQKCHMRMEKLLSNQTAIILVTHSMGAIEKYCQRAILLNEGQPVFEGDSAEAIKRYYALQKQPNPTLSLSSVSKMNEFQLDNLDGYPTGKIIWPDEDAFLNFSSAVSIGNNWVQCTAIALCNSDREPCRVFRHGQRAYFYYEFEALRDLSVPYGAVVITNSRNIIVHGKATYQYNTPLISGILKGTRIRFRQEIALNLAPGQYTFDIVLDMFTQEDYANLKFMSMSEIQAKEIKLNHVHKVGTFDITPSTNGVAWNHFGICDLPGTSEMELYRG